MLHVFHENAQVYMYPDVTGANVESNVHDFHQNLTAAEITVEPH